MNQVIVDGCVQKDVKLFEEIASFNVSVHTGFYNCMDNTQKKRYTYYRVVYPHDITPEVEELIQTSSMIRIYGELDSEVYVTTAGKYVYNKILKAHKITRIRFDKDIEEYVEVTDE